MSEYDELKEYLDSGKLYLFVIYPILTYIKGIMRTPTCVFWKEYQHQYPTLTKLARDILLILAIGAGMERLFNSARDICYYRRGSLKALTVQDLMMFICISKFEIEDAHRALINEYLSYEEIQAN